MKTYPTTNGGFVRMIFCLTVAGACLVTGLAYADGVKSRPTKSKPEQKNDGKKTEVLVTGSNIPQKADRVANTPTTSSPVVVIDRNQIERSGRTTVAGVLSRYPATR
jgi:outer membrane cobalamin receptor